MKTNNFRLVATLVLFDVLEQKKSLTKSLTIRTKNLTKDSEKLQEVVYGSIRFYNTLNTYLTKFLQKPIKKKDIVIYYLLIGAIYQIKFMRLKNYALINASVSLAKELKKTSAKSLINAVLRKISLDQTIKFVPCFDNQQWFYQQIKKTYQAKYKEILANNNLKIGIFLRINPTKVSVSDYKKYLEKAKIDFVIQNEKIMLQTNKKIYELPKYQDGFFSVQDKGSQLAATFLDPKNNEKILDACSAPGGKTTHILELAPKCNLTSVEISQARITKIKENLTRLNLKANLVQGDLLNLSDEYFNFNKILLDPPCSGTGVIKKHPDIKWHRSLKEIENFAKVQLKMLKTCFARLKKGGILLYSTCSILKQENQDVIAKFLQSEKNAKLLFLNQKQKEIQILPTKKACGFYYAKLKKLN